MKCGESVLAKKLAAGKIFDFSTEMWLLSLLDRLLPPSPFIVILWYLTNSCLLGEMRHHCSLAGSGVWRFKSVELQFKGFQLSRPRPTSPRCDTFSHADLSIACLMIWREANASPWLFGREWCLAVQVYGSSKAFNCLAGLCDTFFHTDFPLLAYEIAYI